MKLSARNCIPGTITRIVMGPVSAEVTISIAPDLEIVSVISAASATSLDLSPGRRAFAVIKASNVIVAVDD